MTVTKKSLRSARGWLDNYGWHGGPSIFYERRTESHEEVGAAARFVERLLPEPCEWCRDGQVEAPITGTDPHGAFAAAPHSTCHGTGQIWDEGLVEAVAKALTELYDTLSSVDPTFHQEARAVLAALTQEVGK